MTRIVRLRDVCARTGLSRSTIYDRISKGLFPKPIGLGGRAVGWVEEELVEWIDLQISESRKGQSSSRSSEIGSNSFAAPTSTEVAPSAPS